MTNDWPYKGFEYLNVERTFTYRVEVVELYQYNKDKAANDALRAERQAQLTGPVVFDDSEDPAYWQIDPQEDAETDFVHRYQEEFSTEISGLAIQNLYDEGERQSYFFGTISYDDHDSIVTSPVVLEMGDAEWPFDENSELVGYVIVNVTEVGDE